LGSKYLIASSLIPLDLKKMRDGGRRKEEEGRRKEEGGRRKEEGGRRV
jgi:hypothetical protein